MYYTANNIPETHKHLELRTAKSPHPRFEQYFCCKQDTNYNGTIHYYIESFAPFGTIHKGILCILQEYKGKYHLHPEWQHERNSSFSYDTKRKLLKDLQEPNQIGVFTDKKINDWLEFCVEKVRILEEYEQVHKEKNAALLAEIEEIKKLGTFNEYDNQCTVNTVLFRIELTHNTKEAWLFKEIRFNGGVDDVKKIMEAMEFKAKNSTSC